MKDEQTIINTLPSLAFRLTAGTDSCLIETLELSSSGISIEEAQKGIDFLLTKYKQAKELRK